jgi:hypothetical protein
LLCSNQKPSELFDLPESDFDLTVSASRAKVNTMQLETKFLHLRTPVTIGSRFGDWEVTWLGGWTRDRLSYLVMAVKIERRSASDNLATDRAALEQKKKATRVPKKEDQDARTLRSNRTRTDRRRD